MRARRLPVDVFAVAYALEAGLPDDVDRVMAPLLAVLKSLGPATPQKIAQVLGIGESMVKMRLARFMQREGYRYVEKHGNVYRLTPKGHAVARAMVQHALMLTRQHGLLEP